MNILGFLGSDKEAGRLIFNRLTARAKLDTFWRFNSMLVGFQAHRGGCADAVTMPVVAIFEESNSIVRVLSVCVCARVRVRVRVRWWGGYLYE